MNDVNYKLKELDVPPDDPFSCDALNRESSVEAVSSLIGELSGPFVLAIDSPWGTGKTTFVRMLKAVLEKKEHSCLYFNAWETDFSTDPLVAFLGEITKLISDEIDNSSEAKKKINKVKKLGTLLVKKAIPVAAKVTTGVTLDLDSFTEKAITDYVSSAATDAVDKYLKEKELIDEFHKELAKVIKQLSKEGKPSQIVIFVDEIDRCRPTYAVELLERIKHLFNIENVIFVVSLDKQQLRTSLGAIYGQGIDADEYLRRFIDLEFLLPKPDAEAFTKSLFDRFGFEAFFKDRTNSDFQYEKEDLLEIFIALSNLFNLSLRAREQCFTRIRVAMMTTSGEHYFSPMLTILTLLKAGAPDSYHQYILTEGTAREVVEYLETQKGGSEMLLSDVGINIEAYLIMFKSILQRSEELEAYKAVYKNEELEDAQRERAERLLHFVTYIRNYSLSDVVKKLELAAQFK
ncbi:MAG: P-loop NTPase fold protein [Candidatus Electrothrix scaldis]|nr:MAG: P-loop NTPase fold protein [Candidatus Electrothrix sp. GW3-3]